jgi:hypothetical protein
MTLPLARALAAHGRQPHLRMHTGQVQSIQVGTPTTLTVSFSGSSVAATGISFVSTYFPQVDDWVMAIHTGPPRTQGGGDWLVLGTVGATVPQGAQRQVIQTSTGAIYFTPPAGFANFRLRAYITGVATSGPIAVTVNSDGTANYNWSVVEGNGTAASSASATGATSARIGYASSTLAAPTLIDCTISQCDPSYYASSAIIGNSRASRFDALSVTGMYPELYAWAYVANTGALAFMAVFGAGNFSAGSTFSLAGIP